MDASLRNRLLFGPLMLAGLGGILVFDHYAQLWTRSETMPRGIGGIGITLLMLIIAPLATRELARLLRAVEVKPYRFFIWLGSSLVALHAFMTQFDFFKPIAASTLAFILVFIMLGAALRRALMKQAAQAIHHMAGTVFAMLYMGVQAWFLVALRVKYGEKVTGSTFLILMILLVVKSTDIGAFFGGKTIGRHKLIFWLSPGKTWEGLACGVLTAAGVGAACAAYQYALPAWKGAVFGAVIGAVGQAGDLLESLMKRDAAVKDSGHSIPGFGGILDVIDSPLMAAPFAYLLFSLI
jgi:phosphatidate cytidylyltransferase